MKDLTGPVIKFVLYLRMLGGREEISRVTRLVFFSKGDFCWRLNWREEKSKAGLAEGSDGQRR